MTFTKYRTLKNAKSLQQIAEDSGISYVTVKNVASGLKISLYRVAKKISDATDGKVSVAELCE